METEGARHLVKISANFGSAVNEKRFIGSSHWKIPRKSGKSEKVGPFSRLERSERNCAFHPHLSRSSYQFEAHGKKICHGQFAKQLASLEPSLMYQSGAPYVNFGKYLFGRRFEI